LLNKKLPKSDSLRALVNSKKLIYNALEDGKCFVSNYYHGDATGFRYFAEVGNKIYQMGDKVEENENVKLRVILPNISGTIKLIRNGSEIEEIENIDAEFLVNQNGVYRIEVYLEDKAWIFSNHIRIGC
jgi:hypothetical protein